MYIKQMKPTNIPFKSLLRKSFIDVRNLCSNVIQIPKSKRRSANDVFSGNNDNKKKFLNQILIRFSSSLYQWGKLSVVVNLMILYNIGDKVKYVVAQPYFFYNTPTLILNGVSSLLQFPLVSISLIYTNELVN